MKLLAFSDTHFTRSSEFTKHTLSGLTEYLDTSMMSIGFVARSIMKYKPDCVAFLGDMWEARDYIDTMSFFAGCTAVDAIDSACQSAGVGAKIAILGNHDYWDIDHQIHNLAWLRSRGWVVCDCVTDLYLYGIRVLVIPFRNEYSLENLSKLIADNPSVALSHADVYGGKRRASKGDFDVAAYSSSGLSPKLFENIPIVLNGHYHHPSEVAPNFINVGALTSRTFHDKDTDPRGIVIYETLDRSLIRVPNPYDKKFSEVYLTNEQDVASILDSSHSQEYAKIFYESSLEDSVKAIHESYAGARLIPVKKEVSKATSISVDARFSLMDNLDRYLKEKYPDASELFTSTARKIMLEASSEYIESSSRGSLDFGMLVLENYQSIGNLSLNLRNTGLYFVRGANEDDLEQESNGSGKSSLLEGIYWILTGKSLRGYSVNEVVKWGESYAYGSLEIISGDTTYTIVRSRKHPDFGTGVKLYLGSETISARLASDTQDKLDEVIGRSDKSLRHLCFMMADLSHRYSALSYDERARLLEDIIDIQPYSIAQGLAKTAQANNRNILYTAQGSLNTIESSIVSRRELLEKARKDVELFDVSYSSKKDSVVASMTTSKELINKLESELKGISVDLTSILEDISTMNSKIKEADACKSTIQSKLNSLIKESSILGSDITRYRNLAEKDVCPTCGLAVQTDSIICNLDTLLTSQAVLASDMLVLRNELDRHNSRITKLREAADAKQDLIKKSNESRSSIERDIRSKSDQLLGLNNELIKLEGERARISDKVTDLSKQLNELTSSRDKLSVDIKDLYNLDSVLTSLRDEVFDEKGVRRSMLVQSAVPYINYKTAEYSQQLFGGRVIELSSDDLGILPINDRTYTGCSSGERRRIDLVVQFALNDLAAATGRSRIGFLAVDEVLDKLDEPGVYAVKEVLTSKAATSTILLVSHLKYAAAIMPRQIVLVKKNGTTSLQSISE